MEGRQAVDQKKGSGSRTSFDLAHGWLALTPPLTHDARLRRTPGAPVTGLPAPHRLVQFGFKAMILVNGTDQPMENHAFFRNSQNVE